MSTLKEKVEKTANTIIPQNQPDPIAKHSPQSSIVSTTSNLLKQNKQNDSFEKLELNAQMEKNRLSDLLDTVKNSSGSMTNDDESFADADDFIMNKRSHENLSEQMAHHRDIARVTDETSGKDRTLKQPVYTQEQQVDKFEFDVTEATPPNPKPNALLTPDLAREYPNSILASPSSNRRSMISDYTPSIHEVNKVAYVVEGHSEKQNEEDLPVMGVEDATKNKLKLSRKPSVIKVSRNSSSGSNKKPEHEKNKESINSYYSNPNSGSGSSKYLESLHSNKDYEVDEENLNDRSSQQQQLSQTEKIMEETESASSFDFNLGPLKTTKGLQEPLAIERSAITNVDPAVPSRSQKRPLSSACIKPPVNLLKKEQDSNRSKSVDIGSIDNLMVELNREIYKSPSNVKSSSQESDKVSILPEYVAKSLHERQASAANSISSEKGLSKRPLPPPPAPKHEHIPSFSQDSQDRDQDHDQDYVTEDDDKNESKSVKEAKKKHKRKANKSKKRMSAGFKKGHFNHETLAQLLQVTEGTIIGQEFQNIGLEPTEKQLLERLVDSLSRLTADMVIDADRHDESVRRLNKAIKALEGF